MSEREITITLKGKNLLASDFQKAREQILGLGSASDDAGKRSTGMAGAFKTAAASFAGFLGGAAVIGGLKSAFDFAVGGAIGMNATLEKSTLQFGTLMGDTTKAETHVRSLFEFAKKTPFETGPIIAASLKLQTFGGEALNTMDNLTLLGDASAATGAPIEDLGFWVGRLYANLKSGQPFGEAAARLQELAVLTPEARQEMEAMQKAGKSTEEIFAAFQGRLGEFSGAMVSQANTWDGLTSSIKDAVSIMMADALKPLFDLVKTGAQVVLTALGSDGMEKAFESLKGSVDGSIGPSGGMGAIKSFANVLLTMVDLGLMGLGLFGQGWGVLKTLVYGAVTGIIGAVDGVVQGLALLVETAAKVPGVGDKFKGVAESMRGAADMTGSLKFGFEELTRESWEAAKGNDTWGQSIAGARTVVQALRSEIENATVATDSSTAAVKRATSGKSEFVAQTKAEIEAEKERQKVIEKGKAFADGVLLQERLRRISGEDLRKVIQAGNVEIGNEIAGLGQVKTSYIGVLESSTAVQQQMAGPLKTAIGSTTAELTKLHNAGRSVGDSLKASFKDLPNVIMGALQGGGNVGKSIGSMFGSQLFGADSALTKSVTSGATKLFGSGVGSAIGAAIPGLGTLLGSYGGQLAGKLFGGLFKSEGRKVNDLRDGFVAAAGGIGELDAKAHAAGLTLDRLLKAKNVKDYQSAVEELNAAFGKTEADTELARQAMDEWGISATEAGQKFAQADMDQTANAMLAKLKAATAAGVDLNAIVSKGGDDFGKMVHQAIRSGTTISNEFRPVLAAMIENKTLVDENGEAFTDLSQVPFATDIGAGLKDIGTSLKELADFFMGRTKDAMGEAMTAGVTFGTRVRDALNLIPREIEIDVNGTYNPPNIDGGDPGYAVGTKGRHGDYFVNFGEGQNTRLHGYEAVITPDQAPGFVAEYMKRNGGGGPATVNVYTVAEINTSTGQVTQRVISQREYLKRQMRRIIRANGIPELAGATG